MRRWLYQIVPREASRPQDLTGYLDRDTLIGVWPELHLPKGVRQAWGKHHPRRPRRKSVDTAHPSNSLNYVPKQSHNAAHR